MSYLRQAGFLASALTIRECAAPSPWTKSATRSHPPCRSLDQNIQTLCFQPRTYLGPQHTNTTTHLTLSNLNSGKTYGPCGKSCSLASITVLHRLSLSTPSTEPCTDWSIAKPRQRRKSDHHQRRLGHLCASQSCQQPSDAPSQCCRLYGLRRTTIDVGLSETPRRCL